MMRSAPRAASPEPRLGQRAPAFAAVRELCERVEEPKRESDLRHVEAEPEVSCIVPLCADEDVGHSGASEKQQEAGAQKPGHR